MQRGLPVEEDHIAVDDLALDLNRQACKFVQLEEKMQREYYRANEAPPEENLMNRTMLWGGIQMNTLLNASTEHLADLMIQGNTRGMIKGLKNIHQFGRQDEQIHILSQKLLDCETANIRQMQGFL